MNRLSLTQMAIELLQINEIFFNFTEDPYKYRVYDYSLVTFIQTWGSTSGAFMGIGGSAMTDQRTYVFLPNNSNISKAIVFFGGKFGYKADFNDEFINDLKIENLADVRSGKTRYKFKEDKNE